MTSPAFKKVYAGIEITMTEGGKFSATINAEKVLKPSLTAMQNYIDKKSKFVPFDALVSRWRYGSLVIENVRIIGCTRKQLRYGGYEFHWIDERKLKHSTAYPISAKPLLEAEDALYKKQRKESEALTAEHKKQMEKVRSKLTPIPPPAKN